MATRKKATSKKMQEKSGEPGQRIADALEHIAAHAVKNATGETWEPEPGEPAARIMRAIEALAYGAIEVLSALPEPTEVEGQGEAASEVADAPTGA